MVWNTWRLGRYQLLAGRLGWNICDQQIPMSHGVVNRTTGNYHGQGFMYTHSFADRPWVFDAMNNRMGPNVFWAYDERAKDYAQENFEGC